MHVLKIDIVWMQIDYNCIGIRGGELTKEVLMTIGEYIKATDRNTYNKLLKLCDFKVKKPIALGDSVENLMKHDSYKRVGRRVRQK
jgi:FlaA1/EpsC-like NDP-sugar epimerase